jgi:micrococcal nuclease
MKSLFHGKRKFISIPIVAVLGLAFFPFFIAGAVGYFAHKKISNTKLRYSVFAITAIFTLFFGSAWVAAMVSPSNTQTTQSQPEQSAKVDFNESQATKPTEVAHSPTAFQAQTAPNNPNIVLAKVVKVTDGDTIDVDLGNGNIKTVRYIGIDTPETVDPRTTVQCYGKEASNKNKEIVGNNIVGLEKDVSETDKYGRLLRYVYAGDLLVNQLLVAEGYAISSSYPPDIKYQDKFRQAEQQARNANKGLWGSCNTSTPKPTVKPTTPPAQQSQTTSGGSSKYSCTGPDLDCSDFSSHAEAQAFFDSCGFTAENDPMKLDSVGVGDGIACESQ